MRLVALMIALAALAGACSSSKEVAFDGHVYQTWLEASRQDTRAMTIYVSPASAGLRGAREAALYEATKYCLENFFSSDAVWSIGPYSAADELVYLGDRLEFRGRCEG